MKTILMTAYAVNPYKGSEEGTGWNFIYQAARYNKVIAVTRKNNRFDIERFISERPEDGALFDRIEFLYFDLPAWMITWKKGPLLSALYFYFWQFSVALWLRWRRVRYDVGHSVNFHSNWTPTFLWLLGRPFVWGPVGNHPLIPRQYLIRSYGWKAFLKDRMLWIVKSAFWYFDPFLFIARKKAKKILCVNSQSVSKLRIKRNKNIFMPAVASEKPGSLASACRNSFKLISVGRFVPVKGFDIAINSFAAFYDQLNASDREKVSLLIIGKGPERKRLQRLIYQHRLEKQIMLCDWLPRSSVIKQFSESSAFLFPSHEGAGMVVPEALSFGIPVLCLDNYGPGEYVHPQSKLKTKTGSYPRTIDSIADRLRKLYDDHSFYVQESKLARERYNALFQWDSKGDLLDSIYQQALANNRKFSYRQKENKSYV